MSMNTTAKRPPMSQEDVKKLRARRKANARRMVALALACELCPQVTEDVAQSVLKGPPRQQRRTVTKTATANAQALLDSDEWRGRMVSWLDDFWAQHGHGPTWRAVKKDATLWPEGCPEITKAAVMQMLPGTGLFDGMKTPYGMKVRRAEVSA